MLIKFWKSFFLLPEELQIFTKRYASAQPKPFNSQFENKIGKEEALKKAKEA